MTYSILKNFRTRYRIFCTALTLLMASVFSANATHIAGGDMTYAYVSPGKYRVTLVLYRDCAGIPVQNPEPISVSSSCGQSFVVDLDLIQNTGNQINFPCVSTVTTCNGGNAPGIQRYQYEGDVDLPFACADWKFQWLDCCRNCAITTIGGGCNNGFLIEASVNTLLASTDHSPTFSNYPVAFVCHGQNTTYNHGVVDDEGDSLVYSFIAPRLDNGNDVPFNPGYSATNFLNSSTPITLNSSTGDINFTPASIEVGVTAVRIDEYRNGQLIGSVMRDIQFVVTNCNPNVLPVATGMNGSSDFDTTICAGTPLCFDIFTSDGNQGQELTLTWNNGIPAGSFNVAGSPYPTGTFCWTPTAADARTQPYTFTVMVKDDNCALNGFQIYSYSITVPSMSLSTQVANPVCGAVNGNIDLIVSGNSGPYGYLWSNGATSEDLTGVPAGTYTVTVTDAIGCSKSISATLVPSGSSNIKLTIASQKPTCFGNCDASASVTVYGGTGPFGYLWNNGATTAAISGLCAGTYKVTVTDGNGCTKEMSRTIVAPSAITTTISQIKPLCYGACNGSLTVVAKGGVAGGYNYLWNTGATTATISGLCSGTYTVTVSDKNGCSHVCSKLLQNPSQLSVSSTQVNVNCKGASTGSATASASGGTGPYLYAWSNGQSGPTASNLAAGVYVVTVSDKNGCTKTKSITITQPAAVLSVQCKVVSKATYGSVTATASGGSGTKTYLWSNGSTGSAVTNVPAGTYTVTVTDNKGCTATCSGTVVCGQPARLEFESTAPGISIVPNPFADEFSIVLSDADFRQVIITDITGKVCQVITDLHENLKAGKELKNGMYFLTAINSAGERQTIRLIKTE